MKTIYTSLLAPLLAVAVLTTSFNVGAQETPPRKSIFDAAKGILRGGVRPASPPVSAPKERVDAEREKQAMDERLRREKSKPMESPTAQVPGKAVSVPNKPGLVPGRQIPFPGKPTPISGKASPFPGKAVPALPPRPPQSPALPGTPQPVRPSQVLPGKGGVIDRIKNLPTGITPPKGQPVDGSVRIPAGPPRGGPSFPPVRIPGGIPMEETSGGSRGTGGPPKEAGQTKAPGIGRDVSPLEEQRFPVSISIDPKRSDLCGPTGKIHFDFQNYTEKGFAGTCNLTMTVYKGGNIIEGPYFYPNLNVPMAGTSFDFAITNYFSGKWCGAEPTNAPGFDFVFTATFTVPGGTQVVTLGTPAEGFIPGKDNDYMCSCEVTPPSTPKLELGSVGAACGTGAICFNYSLPPRAGPSTIKLTLFQSGTFVTTLESPPLSASETSYCFPVNPATFPAPFNASLPGFDFRAIGTGDLSNASAIGSRPQGIHDGLNNDWAMTCDDPPGLEWDPNSSKCGRGELCFNYRLIPGQGSAATLGLVIYQSGNPVASVPPFALNPAQTSICITIDPAVVPIDPALGFDWVATGTFTNGNSIPITRTVGQAPEGNTPGVNNDYAPSCEPPLTACCDPKTNIYESGDFEDEREIHSEYALANLDTLLPGTYTFTSLDGLPKACSKWEVSTECRELGDFKGNVMAVNGLTNQAPGAAHVIYKDKITLKEDSEYSICFHYMPLPGCCFDIVATPVAQVVDQQGNAVTLTDTPTGCGNTVFGKIRGPGTFILSIYLPADGNGDGNDLILDNIIVNKINPVPSAVLSFDSSPTNVITTGNLTVFPTAGGGLQSPYHWMWECFDITGLALTNISILPTGATLVATSGLDVPNHTFTGLNPNKQYWVRIVVWSDCEAKRMWRKVYGPDNSSMRTMQGGMEEKDPAAIAIKSNTSRQN